MPHPTQDTLVIGTMHALLWLDPFTGERHEIHKGSGSYYGIAYDEHGFWVACRGDVHGRELPFIGRWHWDGTLVQRIHAPFALADMHQMLLADGKLWVVCAGLDRVARYDLGTGAWDRWGISGVAITEYDHDEHHFNSIERDGDHVLLLAHNQPPGSYRPQACSELWRSRLDGGGAELLAPARAGFCAHNIAQVGAANTWVCDSAGGRLRELRSGREVLTYGFPRGLAWTEEHRFVGLSAHVYDRVKREHSESSLAVFDRDWTLVQRIKLDGCGPVNEVRAPFAGDLGTSMAVAPLPPPPPPQEEGA